MNSNKQLYDKVGKQLCTQVWDQVWHQVCIQVESQVLVKVSGQIWRHIRTPIQTIFYEN